MPVFYVHRNAEQRLRDLVSGLRVVIVNGPRQSGKTTLLRMYQEQSAAAYVTLDDAFQLAQCARSFKMRMKASFMVSMCGCE